MTSLRTDWVDTLRTDSQGALRRDLHLACGITLIVRHSGAGWVAKVHSPDASLQLDGTFDEHEAMKRAEEAAKVLAPELLQQQDESEEQWHSRVDAMHNGMPGTTREFWTAVANRMAERQASTT